MSSYKKENRRRSGLRQEFLMQQPDVWASQSDGLFLDSSLDKDTETVPYAALNNNKKL